MDKNQFLIGLSESQRTDFGKVAFAEQPEEQKVFSAIWKLEGEVNNGGFMQYFENDDGETAGFAATALKRIGAHQCAGLVERAVSALGAGLAPPDPHAWEKLIDGMSDDTVELLDGLDAEFFKYPDDLSGLLFKFVSEHPEVFGPVGDE